MSDGSWSVWVPTPDEAQARALVEELRATHGLADAEVVNPRAYLTISLRTNGVRAVRRAVHHALGALPVEDDDAALLRSLDEDLLDWQERNDVPRIVRGDD